MRIPLLCVYNVLGTLYSLYNYYYKIGGIYIIHGFGMKFYCVKVFESYCKM